MIGYFAQKEMIKGSNLLASFSSYVVDLRRYKLVSMSIRVAAICCLALFFFSVIHFTHAKYGLMAMLIAIFCVQIGWLNRIWNSRIRQLDSQIEQLAA
jgi:hypothetical protein